MYFKHILVLFLVFNIVQSVFSFELAPFSLNARFLAAPSWNCREKGWSCRDCSTRQFCKTPTESEFTINCKDQDPASPYCNPITKNCVPEKDACNEIENGFECPSRGLFPDLQDCKKYTSCIKEGRRGITYHCSRASVFNFTVRKCVTGATCYTVTAECAGKRKAIPYKPNPSYYVICQGTDDPLLKYCKNDNFLFNAKTVACEFVCKAEGMYPDPDQKNKFYTCVKNGNVFEIKHKDCMADTEFDETTGNCVLVSDNVSETNTGPPVTTALPGTTL